MEYGQILMECSVPIIHLDLSRFLLGAPPERNLFICSRSIQPVKGVILAILKYKKDVQVDKFDKLKKSAKILAKESLALLKVQNKVLSEVRLNQFYRALGAFGYTSGRCPHLIH